MNESRSILIIGFLFAGALILGLGFCLGGRSSDRSALPILRIVTPASGDSSVNPVTLTFVTPAPLRLHPQLGWMAGELHLHAMADTTELMPAAHDITAVDDSTFQWRLPALDSGVRRIYLTWAGRHHGNLPTTTDTVLVHILP